MRTLVHRYLEQRLSRRAFIRGMGRLGFSAAAAASVLESLRPLAEAAASDAGPLAATTIEGDGATLLVEQLRAAGVRFVFNCNSSGTYAVFDALVDRPEMTVIEVPQEGQMVAVAQGFTLASGEVAFTLNGSVGFPNTLNNMYNAWKDRTPLVVAAQREPRRVQGGRDAFEEWDDYLAPSAAFTRWRWSVDQVERVPEITRRAFTIATTPPEGPVTLAFPTDVLASPPARAAIVDRRGFLHPPRLRPDAGLVEEAARALLAATSPLIVVGSEVTRSGGRAAAVALAERLAIPVAQGDRLFDDFPTAHPLFVGDYGWPPRHASDVDLVLNLGAKMPDRDAAMPRGARVLHVSVDAGAIGRVVLTDVGIAADVKETATDLLAAVGAAAARASLDALRDARLATTTAYTARVRAARAAAAQARWNQVPLSWERVAGELDAVLEPDAVIVPELGRTTWLEHGEDAALSQFTFGPGQKSKIGRTTGSALGWGVGAAIGVKLALPDRQVVALQGDGGFLFGQAETLWTMARYEVPVLVVVFDNRSYNGPRNKILAAGGRQAQTGKDMTCYLGHPDVDFAKIAAGFGVAGEVVATPGELRPAIERAVRSMRDGRPYLIDALVGRTGRGADSTWYPRYSVAAARRKEV